LDDTKTKCPVFGGDHEPQEQEGENHPYRRKQDKKKKNLNLSSMGGGSEKPSNNISN